METPNANKTPAVFNSAVDWWYYLLLIGTGAIALHGAAPLLLTGLAGIIAGAVIIVLVLVIPIWFLLATHYTLDEFKLVIRAGPLRWEIPYGEIVAVRHSRSLLAAPALSLRRLELRLKPSGIVHISPARQADFLDALEARCEHLR